MEIKKAEFIRGVVGDDYSTKDNFPQFVFFGRSNAGKSSVINSLVGRKNLVKTSKVPGETTEANFFLINNSFYFVDFPGYGYAKRSLKQRNKMIKRIFWYIESSQKRPETVFLISDIKVGLTDLDLEMLDILKKNNHKVVIIANKSDKLGKKAKEEKVKNLKENNPGIEVVAYSAKTKKGKEDVLKFVESSL